MSLLSVLFAIAILIWLIPIVRSGRMFVLAIAILGVGTVLGPAFFAIDGPIQVSLDRVMFFMMIALAAVGWRLGYISLPSLNRMDYLVAAIVLWFYLSAASGEAPPGTPPIARWLFYIAMPAGMHAIMRVLKVDSRDVRWLTYGTIGLGIYLAITAVCEIKGLHGLVFPKFIVDADQWEFYGRGRGPLMNPSGNGIVISLGLIAATVAFINATPRKKVVLGIVIVCLLGGVYATLTRSAWLGAVAAVGLIGLAYSPRWVRVLGLAAAVIVAGLAVAGLKEQLIRMKRDKNLTAVDAEKSMKLRPLLAIVAWEMFKDKPITGHGYGHYFANNGPYHNDRSYGMPLEQARRYYQHNVLLSVLVDTGLIGFSLFVGWIGVLALSAWRLARDKLASRESRIVGWLMIGFLVAYFCNGMFQDVMIIPMVHMYLFFLAGLTATVYQAGLAAQGTRVGRRAEDASAGDRRNGVGLPIPG